MASRLIIYLLLILSVGLPLGIRAQSHMFLPFGESKKEVLSYLQNRDYVIEAEEDRDLNVVRAILSNQKQIEYAFYGNRLYAITMLNHYTNLSEASSAQQHLLEYLKSSGAPEITRTGEEPFVCYTAITSSRVLKVFIRQHTSTRSIILSSISLAHGPDMTEDDFFYERRYFPQEGNPISKGAGGGQE